MTPPAAPTVSPEFHEGVRLHKAGRVEEAGRVYREVLAQTPEHADALHLLGVVHHQQGEHHEALQLIGRAIAIRPDQAAYWNNYGAALLEVAEQHAAQPALTPDPSPASGRGEPIPAMACFHHALKLKPQYADALANLGLAQERLGQDGPAVESLRAALKLDPEHADALGRLAALLQRLGRGPEALETLTRAARARPKAETWVQVGNLQLGRGAAAEAVAAYEEALRLDARSAAACFNLGSALQEQHCTGEAADAFRRAAELRPDRPLWRLRLATVCPAVFESAAAIDAFCEQSDRELQAWLAAPPRATLNDLLSTAAFPNLSYSYLGRNVRQLKEQFARLYEHYFANQPPPGGSGQRDRRRIGIVVTQRHEGIFLRCTKPIWQALDRERFELVLLASEASVRPLERELRLPGLRCVALPTSLPEAIRRIRQSACDLIYYWEVGSDALNYLLPFARLAPVQCTSHGSQITSGVPAVDWFLSSAWLEGDGAEDHYTERLWRAESLLMCRPRLSAAPGRRGDFGLPEDRTLYACLQNPLKLHPDFDALLAGILRRDPRGLVVLLAGRHDYAAARLQARFARTLGEAAERVVFLPWQPFDDYCRLLATADVVLDPPHFGHGSSAYDVFSLDKALVTMPGELIVGRVGAAFYRRMGLDDLIAAGPEEYIAAAARLGVDRDHRRAVEQRIATASHVLFDDRTVVTEHERFFTAVLTKSP